MTHPLIQAALAIVQPPRVPNPGTLHLNTQDRLGLAPCHCLEHSAARAQKVRSW